MDARVYISELSTKPNDYKRVMTTLSKESMHEQRENHLPRLILLASGYVNVSIKPEGVCVYHQATKGVACLVHDIDLDGFFIRIVSLSAKKVTFEQQILPQLDIQKKAALLLTIACTGCTLGLKFSSWDDREKFVEKAASVRQRLQQPDGAAVLAPRDNSRNGGSSTSLSPAGVKPTFTKEELFQMISMPLGPQLMLPDLANVCCLGNNTCDLAAGEPTDSPSSQGQKGQEPPPKPPRASRLLARQSGMIAVDQQSPS